MSVELVYHTLESSKGGTSPFDAAIQGMLNGDEVLIASPYLGLEYLRQITKGASWKLITDLEAWLAISAMKHRDKIVDFVNENADQVHHCKDFHAKVVLAGNKALVGSANFTEKGIFNRVEMSVLFENCAEVEELRGWYGDMWCKTQSVSGAVLKRFSAKLPPPASGTGTGSLPCAFPGIKSQFQKSATLPDKAGVAQGPPPVSEQNSSLIGGPRKPIQLAARGEPNAIEGMYRRGTREFAIHELFCSFPDGVSLQQIKAVVAQCVDKDGNPRKDYNGTLNTMRGSNKPRKGKPSLIERYPNGYRLTTYGYEYFSGLHNEREEPEHA